uniref:C2H2-type domain-containing protein n=1 Tax=Rhodnius prolixus TaxID=13249 RepID=T1I964_RHOPR
MELAAASAQCEVCKMSFSSGKNLTRHRLTCSKSYTCKYCRKKFLSHANGIRHETTCPEEPKKKKKFHLWEPKKGELYSDQREEIEYETAFKHRLKSWFFICVTCQDLHEFLSNIRGKIIDKIKKLLESYTAIKVNIMVECVFVNTLDEKTDRSFKTKNKPVFQATDVVYR